MCTKAACTSSDNQQQLRVYCHALRAGVDGTTLKEAKYINLSLHYLEQVIVALQERSMGLAR